MNQEKRKYLKFSLKDDAGMAWTPRNYSNIDHNLQYLTKMLLLVWAVRKHCGHHHHSRLVPHSRQHHHDLRHPRSYRRHGRN